MSQRIFANRISKLNQAHLCVFLTFSWSITSLLPPPNPYFLWINAHFSRIYNKCYELYLKSVFLVKFFQKYLSYMTAYHAGKTCYEEKKVLESRCFREPWWNLFDYLLENWGARRAACRPYSSCLKSRFSLILLAFWGMGFNFHPIWNPSEIRGLFYVVACLRAVFTTAISSFGLLYFTLA